MSGMIRDLSENLPQSPITVEVCVIGSGAGGATVAWELARAGREVLMLEEGPDRTGDQLTQRDGEMYDQLYMDRGGRTTEDLSISVLQGRVLGGGGVVNASDVVPLSDGVLHHWARHYGLTGLTPEVLEPFRARALEDLSANRIAEAALNRNNRLLREGAQALGWRGEVMLHNRQGCLGEGTCLIGCPVNAKQNMRMVAIPRAMMEGARVWLRARAVRLRKLGEELKEIDVRALDPRGYHEQGAVAVRARTVVVAASAVGTAQLLLRSGVSNPHLGRHLSLQPQLPISAVFPEEVRAFRGIPQAYAVTEFEQVPDETRGWGGFRIEAIGGTPGIVSSLLPWMGEEGRERMRAYAFTASSLLLTPDEGTGVVELRDGARPRIDYTLSDEQKARFRAAVKAAAKLYLAAGATEVLVPTVTPLVLRSEGELHEVDGLTFAAATAPLLSAHQQGTARMATRAADGVVDPEGRVFETRDVYVADSSVFPTSASSHIMAPVITMARYLAQGIAANSPR